MRGVIGWGIIALLPVVSATAADVEWEAESTVQFRYFTHENTVDDTGAIGYADHQFSPSINQQVEFSTEDSRGDLYVGNIFLHYDSVDDENRYGDIRELAWLGNLGDYQARFGVSQVNWGVNEIFRTVDVINQIDTQAWPERQKLGQPLMSLATEFDDHMIELYALFGHRKRRYSGEDGRLRYPLLVDNDEAIYERGETGEFDFAVRWQFTLFDTDLSVSHFYGVDREPYFTFNFDFDRPRLIPVYQKINQTSLEVSKSIDELLVKGEAKYQVGGLQHFYSIAGGVEYPLAMPVFDNIDMTLYIEGIYDSRDEMNNNIFDRDVAFAGRLAFNDRYDSSLLVALVQDYEYQERVFLLNLTTRPSDQWQLTAMVNIFDSQETPIDRSLYDDAWDNAFSAIEEGNLPLPVQIVSNIYNSIPDLTLSQRDFDSLVEFINEIQQPGGFSASYADTVPDALFHLMTITDRRQKINVIENDDYIALSLSYLF